MSKISLTKSARPDNKTLVGSEAKNPLPPNSKNNPTYTDVAGLSWVILDDPFNFRNYA